MLLVWRHRFLADRWGWELPGGLVDEAEDAGEAAVRVVEDAAGYRPGRVERLITFQPMGETVDCEHAVFVGREPERVGGPVEVARVDWVPLGSVPQLITEGQIWSAATLVALMRLLTLDGPAVSA